jgi:hypothetical protein
MTRPFDHATRRNIAALCAAFVRLPENHPVPALKWAAVALGDIERPDAFDFTAIPESTRRVVRFRHAGQFIHAPTAA